MAFSKLRSEKQSYYDDQQSEALLQPGDFSERQYNKPKRCCEVSLPSSFFFYTSICLINLCVGLLIGYGMFRFSKFHVSNFGIDPRTPIPNEIFTNRKDVSFKPYPEYMGPGKMVDENWKMLTEGSDSIYLPEPYEWGLKDAGIHAPFFIFNEPPASASSLSNINNFYVLNTLHQLHCTNMIRKRYNELVYDPTTDPLADDPVSVNWIEHIELCIEYLRLSITCADYMTFESNSPPGSPEEYYEGGLAWGVHHSCIDWDRLMTWQKEQVALYNSTWG